MNKQSIINWSKLSTLLANNSDSIRENRIPEKYKAKVEFILRFEEFMLKELKNIK